MLEKVAGWIAAARRKVQSRPSAVAFALTGMTDGAAYPAAFANLSARLASVSVSPLAFGTIR